MDERLRAALDSVFAAPAYDWNERPNPFAIVSRAWDALMAWLARLQQEHPEAFSIVFWVLAAALLGLVLRAAWVVLRAFRAPPRDGEAGEPALRARDAAWYRAEAERLARAGHFVEAMQADFLALTLELDQRRLVRYHPSKTPQEYVREAALPDAARADLRDLVWTLYRHAFAREPITAGETAAWRARATPNHYAPAH